MHGSPWRAWGNRKGDFYLSARVLGHVVKASFHRDGRCQVGFTQEYLATAEARFGRLESRHRDRWTVSVSEKARLIQVVTPAQALRPHSGAAVRDVVSLQAPGPRQVALVSLLATPSGMNMVWPDHMEASIFGSIEHEQRTLWLVHTAAEPSAEIASWLNRQLRTIQALAKSQSTHNEEGLRAAAFAVHDEDRRLVEFAPTLATRQSSEGRPDPP